MIWPADSPHLRISVLFVRWLTDLLLSCLDFVHRRGEGIRGETVRSWHNLFLYVRFFPFHKLSSSPPLLSGNTSFYNTHHFSHGNRAEQTVAFTKSPSQPNSYLQEPQENDVLLFPVQQRFSHHTLSQFIWPISRTWDAKPQLFLFTRGGTSEEPNRSQPSHHGGETTARGRNHIHTLENTPITRLLTPFTVIQLQF